MFTHLHVHTEYSLLDGSAKISELLSRCKELNMNSLAITDHGVMYGVVDFYKKAIELGIKPILGSEVYVAPTSRFDKNVSISDNNYYHLVLLAENNIGYHNIMKLVSIGFTEGFYYRPRVDLEVLKQYSEGVIALSACLAGPVCQCLLNDTYQKAKEIALLYNEVFGNGNFFLELQDHNIAEQKKVNTSLIKIAEDTGIPLVCTNDVHYINKDDSESHDVLLCIQTAKTVDEPNRMRYEGDNFYLKSYEEMQKIFSYVPEAIENTNKIAKRCNVSITFHELKLPKFKCKEGKVAKDYLREICEKGLKNRYGDKAIELKERLDFELDVITNMGYVDYFLIVWDFIRFAKEEGISVGPGRGSAAGSIVSYCLNITNIDPIKYDLIFERFLNPERVSMPDIDIDFCYERRQEVINYVVEKYGETHVAQIITFGTLAARAAVKDVGRALGMPYAEVDRVSKMIPFEIGITLKRALTVSADLNLLYNEDDDVKKLIDMSMRLEGLPRHASTHAAGVVICEGEVSDYVPLNINDGVITTQFAMNTLEELGLLKMDFLGLRTLTVIENALKEVKRNHGIDLDMDKVDFEDEKVYQLISQGKTEGVFQLESSGMKSFMKELKPERFEDIIAGVALYRPGPMDFIPKYVKGKNSKTAIAYTHSKLEPILKDTYGCIVYQEQVMRIVRELAGYSLGRSDLVRRAMSKKKADVMEKEKKYFIFGDGDTVPGCVANGIEPKIAEEIFDEMTDFAKYAFNKSHAAAYAILAYQTAYLKVYYPIEFMSALLTSVMDSASKVSEYIMHIRSLNIDILPPSINESQSSFSVSGGKIRYGLSGVKNVGRHAVSAIIAERSRGGNFKTLTEFINRVDEREINKRLLESLIKAGAFDEMGAYRSQYITMFSKLVDGVGNAKKRNLEGQMNLFESMNVLDNPYEDILPNVKPYTSRDQLEMEKEVLGVYISGHPLNEYMDRLTRKVSMYTKDFASDSEEPESLIKRLDGVKAIMGGLVSDVTKKYTKNNQLMAFVTLQDIYGFVEIIVFPDTFNKYAELIFVDSVIIVEGSLTVSDDGVCKMKAFTIKDINDDSKSNTFSYQYKNTRNNAYKTNEAAKNKQDNAKKSSVGIIIPKSSGITNRDLKEVLEKFSGDIPVYMFDEATGIKSKADDSLFVTVSDTLINELKTLVGEGNVIVR